MRATLIVAIILCGCSAPPPEKPKEESNFVPFEREAACWLGDAYPDPEDIRWCDPNKLRT